MGDVKNKSYRFSFYDGIFRKIPGGSMILPLLLAALLNTLFPNLFGSLGGMTTAMFSGSAMCLSGIVLFAVGTSLDLKKISQVARRGLPLFAAKILIDFAAGIIYVRLFGMDGIFGISAVAFVCAICACNPGIYSGLMQDYGDETDLAISAIVNIAALPFWPLLVLSSTGAGAFPWKDVMSALVPLLLGVLCGMLDSNLKKVMMPVLPISMPFMGVAFGSGLNLVTAVKAGVSGIVLAVLYIAINGVVLFAVDRLICKRPGYCGISWVSVTGISMVAPTMLGATYAGYVESTVPQLMLTLILSSLVTGRLTKEVVKRWGSPKCPKEQGEGMGAL